jgi:hypothetical protein
MYAGSHRRSFPFFLDVVAAISDEGPSIAVCHHVGPKVAAIDPAKRDGAAIAIQRARLARNLVFANQCAQVFGGSLPSGPSIGARLARLRRVDPPKAIGHAIDLERIAVNHTQTERGRARQRARGRQPGRTVSSTLASLRLRRHRGDRQSASNDQSRRELGLCGRTHRRLRRGIDPSSGSGWLGSVFGAASEAANVVTLAPSSLKAR